MKFVAQAAKWLLWLLVAAWTVVALGALVLHGFIVPRIDEFRPHIETRLSRALGVPLSIGHINARSEGVFPTIELADVALLDAAGAPALRLKKVVATVSPASIWRAGFEQLYVGEPDLEIRRRADGTFNLGGLKFGDPAGAKDDDHDAADWLFAQRELVVEGGAVRFVDEQTGAAPLAFEKVDLVLRNAGRKHEARIDATPPEQVGERFTLMATMRQPLFSLHKGRWREWSGQIYADVPRVSAESLAPWLARGDGAEVAQGRGSVRAWADVKRAQVTSADAQVTAFDVRARAGKDLAPLALKTLAARIEWRAAEGGFDLSADELRLVAEDGAVWPGSDLRLSLRESATLGELRSDRIDLAMLSRIALGLPMDGALREVLVRHAPKGQLEDLEANWQRPTDAELRYSAKGRAVGLEFAAQPSPKTRETGMPGARNLNAVFDFDQSGGKAQVSIEDGSLSFPGIFEDPLVAVSRLSSTVEWQVSGEQFALQFPDLVFANADAAGQARIGWRTSDPATAKSKSRFPGVLDLEGSLSRANATRVYRYLPLDLPRDVRHYVAQAVIGGSATSVKFKVAGDIREIPFSDPRRGEFRIAANVRDATFAYVPRSMQPASEAPWPPLSQLSGEVVFERASMRVNGARGRFGAAPGLPFSDTSAKIADLDRPVVSVAAELNAPLADMLKVVKSSPIDSLIGGSLSRASGTGAAGLKLSLTLPVTTLEKSTLQGSVALANNDLRIVPDSPLLQNAGGTVSFNENGFKLEGATARLYGGQARIEGTSGALGNPVASDAGAPLAEFRAQGSVTAEGLRSAGELGALARLAAQLEGETGYEARLAITRNGPELLVTSDLQGLASTLPAPLAKTANSALPLRFENAPLKGTAGVRPQDRIKLDLGQILSAHYVRDVSSDTARALRGSIALGLPAAKAAPLPTAGVAARIELAQFDADTWETFLDPPNARAAAAKRPADKDPDAALRSYWPTQWQARVANLEVLGYRLDNVVLDGTRDAAQWRTEIKADQLAGQLQWREGEGSAPGIVSARLKRLALPDPQPAAANLAPEKPAERLPALDVVVDDFELHGLKLGRLEIDAVNRTTGTSPQMAGTREWRLNKLNLTTPDARFSANGSWARAGARIDALRTKIDFSLDIADSGALLSRFGMKNVLKRGRGAMEGRLAWSGSPLSLDYPTLAGQFHLSVESGQFLKADPGLAKLLGVLSLQALPRRLTLDFRDIFSDGFAFDFIR
ncbi:MAG: YhdP family protein, partial [Burkholderiales bacterium]